MRVGILALLQESNTFAPAPTTIEDFKADLFVTGDDVRAKLADAPHEVGGFFAGLDQAGLDAVPVFAARAIPWGPMTADTLDELCNRMFASLAKAGPLDGILVAAHGATVSKNIPDVDGYWLTRLRNTVGQDVPIIGTLDLHANLSRAMVEATNALIAYRTNPHLDQRERGIEAAFLMARVLNREVRPTQAAVLLPLLINIECQNSEQPPARNVLDRLSKMLDDPAVLGASFLFGFPYADVEELGSATLVVTDNSFQRARERADELAEIIWERRQEFVAQPVPVQDAIDRARTANHRICMLDVGDNIGGGGPADATYLAHAILEANLGPSLVSIHDPETVHLAAQSGAGSIINANIGGKQCEGSGRPIVGNFRVKELCSGKFSETKPRHGGFLEFDQGRTVVLEGVDNLITIVVMSRRTPPYSLAQLTSCNIDPTKFRVIAAKGVHAPVAAYQEVCHEFIRVNTEGVTTADVSRLHYSHRRTPLYPFEMHTSWKRRDEAWTALGAGRNK